MPKLYLKRGLPGSGKSTSAREMVTKDGNTVRINFDDLRASLFNGKWSGKKEGTLQLLCADMVKRLAAERLNVIIDNTNLTQRHVDRYKLMAKEAGLDFVEQRHDLGLDQCVFHDNHRVQGHVGRAVIERLAYSSGWFQFGPTERLWIFDVDGTLADCEWRRTFLNGEKKDWDGFFSAAQDDKSVEVVAQWARNLYSMPDYWHHEEIDGAKDKATIVICSGRSDDYCDLTVEWLNTHNIPFDHIFMRRRGDKREDFIVKNEILNFLPKQQIVGIVDDRQQVIDMWRRVRQQENLTYRVYQVAEGNF